ncbi:tetrahydrofolate synthase [Segatella salivae]|uniref:tetrahydrofolate synthase n=1 Tax=Segatella salivae TaxID=228604 RepID=UPI0028D0E87F|nr:tetrahydrofolate synthase [Segatella salivae]
MNEFTMMNAVTMQRRMCYVGIPMNVFGIVNVVTTQHHMFYAGISMNIFGIVNVVTTQLGTSCSFDSPGLARNEPTPGKRSQGDSTL